MGTDECAKQSSINGQYLVNHISVVQVMIKFVWNVI